MNETPLGSSGAVDGGGPPRRGLGEQSPLQARAAFLKNWNWELVVSLNRAACERGRAQHGANPQVGDSCSRSWEEKRLSEISLIETLDFLRTLHKSAPFLFFNGNTFADIGRRTCDVVFADLRPTRRRELASAVAHYIAGVLDRDAMVSPSSNRCASRPRWDLVIVCRRCAGALRARLCEFWMMGAWFGIRMDRHWNSPGSRRA